MKIPIKSEHHDPLSKQDYLSLQHIERYRFACSILQPGQEVLDIGCGSGYGTAMLLKFGYKVIGADIDNEIIKEAQMRWNHDGFVVADALNLPFPGSSFDAIVSFETIEHVEDGEGFLAEVQRVLRPQGLFICSTPNTRYTAHPRYHLKEYEPEEFFSLFEKYFIDVRHYGQYFKITDRLRDLFQWHLFSTIIKLLEIAHLKTWVKKLIYRKGEKIGNPFCNTGTYDCSNLDTSLQIMGDNYYKVQPLRGIKWLRIMVAVGRKK